MVLRPSSNKSYAADDYRYLNSVKQIDLRLTGTTDDYYGKDSFSMITPLFAELQITHNVILGWTNLCKERISSPTISFLEAHHDATQVMLDHIRDKTVDDDSAKNQFRLDEETFSKYQYQVACCANLYPSTYASHLLEVVSGTHCDLKYCRALQVKEVQSTLESFQSQIDQIIDDPFQRKVMLNDAFEEFYNSDWPSYQNELMEKIIEIQFIDNGVGELYRERRRDFGVSDFGKWEQNCTDEQLQLDVDKLTSTLFQQCVHYQPGQRSDMLPLSVYFKYKLQLRLLEHYAKKRKVEQTPYKIEPLPYEPLFPIESSSASIWPLAQRQAIVDHFREALHHLVNGDTTKASALDLVLNTLLLNTTTSSQETLHDQFWASIQSPLEDYTMSRNGLRFNFRPFLLVAGALASEQGPAVVTNMTQAMIVKKMGEWDLKELLNPAHKAKKYDASVRQGRRAQCGIGNMYAEIGKILKAVNI